jgi:hypothetical protein
MPISSTDQEFVLTGTLERKLIFVLKTASRLL